MFERIRRGADELVALIRQLVRSLVLGQYTYVLAILAVCCAITVLGLLSQEDWFPKHRSTIILAAGALFFIIFISLFVSIFIEEKRKLRSTTEIRPIPTPRSRRLRILGAGASVALLLSSGIGFVFGRETVGHDPPTAQEYLRTRGYPPDLLARQARLTKLKLGPSIDRLDWLDAPNLRFLDLAAAELRSTVDHFPPRLERLNLHDRNIKGLPALPRGLRDLDVGWTGGFQELSSLPPALVRLAAEKVFPQDYVALPDSIETLVLSDDVSTWLKTWPLRLSNLSLTASPMSVLEKQPPLLRRLKLDNPVGDFNPEHLPATVTDLHLESVHISDLASLPEELRALVLKEVTVTSLCPLAEMELDTLHLLNVTVSSSENRFCGLPETLRSFTYDPGGNGSLLSLDDLPEALQELALGFEPSERFSELPAHLKRLALLWTDAKQFQNMPSSLVSLEILSTGDLHFRDRLPEALETLVLHGCKGFELPDFPSTLRHLDISSCKVTLGALPPIPEGLLSLNLSGTDIEELPSLPDSLERLDIANTDLTLPEDPPPNLIGLTLHEGQAESLKDVPGCLRELAFVEDLQSD